MAGQMLMLFVGPLGRQLAGGCASLCGRWCLRSSNLPVANDKRTRLRGSVSSVYLAGWLLLRVGELRLSMSNEVPNLGGVGCTVILSAGHQSFSHQQGPATLGHFRAPDQSMTSPTMLSILPPIPSICCILTAHKPNIRRGFPMVPGILRSIWNGLPGRGTPYTAAQWPERYYVPLLAQAREARECGERYGGRFHP